MIRIALPWPAKELSPNSRAHHMTLWRAKKAAKETANWATRAAVGRDKPAFGDVIPVRVSAFPPKHWSTGDDDNLISRCKAYFDGIAGALGVNDSAFRQDGVTWGHKTDIGEIIIELEEAS